MVWEIAWGIVLGVFLLWLLPFILTLGAAIIFFSIPIIIIGAIIYVSYTNYDPALNPLIWNLIKILFYGSLIVAFYYIFIKNIRLKLISINLYLKYKFLKFGAESYAIYNQELEKAKKSYQDEQELKKRTREEKIKKNIEDKLKNKIKSLSLKIKSLEIKINKKNIFIFEFNENDVIVTSNIKKEGYLDQAHFGFQQEKGSEYKNKYFVTLHINQKDLPDLYYGTQNYIIKKFAKEAGRVMGLKEDSIKNIPFIK